MIHSVPGKLEVNWNGEVRAIIDKWLSYNVTLDEFRDAVLEKGLNHAKANKGQAWIVDSNAASGNFSQEIQDFIGSDIFPAFAKNGIKYFITTTAKSALTQLTVKTFAAKTGPHGIKLVEVDTAENGVKWLKENA